MCSYICLVLQSAPEVRGVITCKGDFVSKFSNNKINFKAVSQFTGNISTAQLSLDSALFVLKKERKAEIFAVLPGVFWSINWRAIRKLIRSKELINNPVIYKQMSN